MPKPTAKANKGDVEHNEQKILEGIIEAHFDALEFYKQSPEKNSSKIITEKAALIVYIGKYGAYGKHPKYWTYNGRILDLG